VWLVRKEAYRREEKRGEGGQEQKSKQRSVKQREKGPLFDSEASAPKKHYKSIKPSTQPFLTTFNFLVNLWFDGFSHNTARENRDTVFGRF
jgi:hypothetical protein